MINNNTFSGNSGINGGGIHNNGTLTLNNSTLSGNTAGSGGGIYNNYGSSTLIVNNSTLSNNNASLGGGIENNGTLNLFNSIVANSSGGGDCISYFGTINANVKTLIEDNSCNPALAGDPNLGPLANNGGSTLTHALLPGSPAIDAGDNATCTSIDQRGFVRPVDGNGDGTSICDIGAVEMLATTLPAKMTVIGNNSIISNGDTLPSFTDHTDFGSTVVTNGAVTRTFTISNSGGVDLLLNGSPLITFTGDISDFKVVIPPITPIHPGSSTTFQIRFTPTALGLRTALVTIANTDPYENPYTFNIQGNSTCAPSLTVTSKNDSGPDTLRDALTNICNGGTINFAPLLANQTIVLTSTYLYITKTITLTNPSAANLQISGNNAHNVFIIETGAVITISNLGLLNGTSNFSNGGAIRNRGTLTVNNSIFSNNYADLGGAISNEGTLILNRDTFKNNSVRVQGGAINNQGTLILNNSTLSSNSAPYGGGGIYNSYSGVLTATNNTFSENSTTYNNSSGIYNSGILYLSDNILANSASGGDCYNGATIAANVNNLIEDGSCNPALSGDPLLGSLANNGGSTLTHALLPGSSAIDAGDNATCLSTDQRGVSRPVDGNGDNFAVCDIGAYEAPGPSTPIIQFTQAVYTTTENIGISQNVILTRTGSLTNASQVQVNLSGGTATAGTDYSSAGFPKTVVFGSGVISQTVPLTLTDDGVVEPTETISLTVTPLVNAVIGLQNNTVLQIQDNDVASAPESKVYLPLVIK